MQFPRRAGQGWRGVEGVRTWGWGFGDGGPGGAVELDWRGEFDGGGGLLCRGIRGRFGGWQPSSRLGDDVCEEDGGLFGWPACCQSSRSGVLRGDAVLPRVYDLILALVNPSRRLSLLDSRPPLQQTPRPAQKPVWCTHTARHSILRSLAVYPIHRSSIAQTRARSVLEQEQEKEVEQKSNTSTYLCTSYMATSPRARHGQSKSRGASDKS